MLQEQYRMHPRLSRIISDVFYSASLRTAPSVAEARHHPLPVCYVEGGGQEQRPRGATSYSNEAEADAVVRLVQLFVQHGGHGQDQINVLTFYNGQRSLIARKLKCVPHLDSCSASPARRPLHSSRRCTHALVIPMRACCAACAPNPGPAPPGDAPLLFTTVPPAVILGSGTSPPSRLIPCRDARSILWC